MKPYYEDEAVTLYHGDFRDVLPALGRTFDAIVTDPPYGETSLEWDVWPTGWPSAVAPFARSMWCFGSMRMFLDRRDEFADWRLSQDVVWEKHNGSGFHADRFRRIHEHALHWYQGAWEGVRHVVPTTATATARTVRSKRRPSHTGHIERTPYVSVDGGPKLMESVLYAASMHGRAINETEKPVGILEPLIEYAVPPGGGLARCVRRVWLIGCRGAGDRATGGADREARGAVRGGSNAPLPRRLGPDGGDLMTDEAPVRGRAGMSEKERGMSDIREALVAHLERVGMGYGLHDGLKREVLGAWADAILAEFDVTPRGVHNHDIDPACPETRLPDGSLRGECTTNVTPPTVKPTLEQVVDVLAAQPPGRGEWTSSRIMQTARAVLALLPGRSKAEVKAEALREAAETLRAEDKGHDRWYADWLDEYANKIEREADRD